MNDKIRDLSPDERRNIPVVINNFNRLTTLRLLIERLNADGLKNIHVLDNGSTYQPLLDYYPSMPARLVGLGQNIGYLALWESGFSLSLGDAPFIYTDSDVYPDQSCPADYLDCLFEQLATYPQLDKVGLGLRLDDLPPASPTSGKVVEHETAFWARPLSRHLFDAAVDTTFALYRPGRCGGHWLNGGRTAPPYLARHAPWYLDPSNLGEEEEYYRANLKTMTHWSAAL